jgi:hypothetical protein
VNARADEPEPTRGTSTWVNIFVPWRSHTNTAQQRHNMMPENKKETIHAACILM